MASSTPEKVAAQTETEFFNKNEHEPALDDYYGDDYDDDYHNQYATFKRDEKDMARMGKKQELKRSYRVFSALSFVIVLQQTWEVLIDATSQGLTDGGVAGLFWSYVWTFFGFGLIVISLAEMSSMAPTAGGQYHWTSEFAPKSIQKPLSYFIGWQSVLSWQAGQASGPFLFGTILQGVITVNYPNYNATNWAGTLLVFASVVVIFILNVWGADLMPLINNLFFLLHCLGFLAILLVLWILAPRNTAAQVFGSVGFMNEGGWNSLGLALMVGQISPIYALICTDSAAHISEEIENASLTVPRTMFWSYTFNGVLGIIMLITYLFALTDVDAALDPDVNPSGYPFLWVFQQAVNSAGFNVLSTIMLILVFAGTVSFNISTSRQTWSFARDRGLPFSDWIGRVNHKRQIPVNSIILTCICTCLLACINFGSNAAFNAIISLNLVTLMLTYFSSISCLLWRRLCYPETLPFCRWSLGRFGVPVNIGALLYSFFAFFWCFWPNSIPVNPQNFNWAVVMFAGVTFISVFFYFVQGRKQYLGPVSLVSEDAEYIRRTD